MGDYTVGDLANAASRAGLSGAGLVTAVAVSLAEDGAMSLTAVNTNTDGSRDRGPWQINDRAHPDVSDACAFNLDCAAGAMARISSQGGSWTPWTTYTGGQYRQHLTEAQAAAAGVNPSAPAAAGPSVGPIDLTPITQGISSFTDTVARGAQIGAGGLLVLLGLALAVVLYMQGRR